jgi:hypothetical protein
VIVVIDFDDVISRCCLFNARTSQFSRSVDDKRNYAVDSLLLQAQDPESPLRSNPDSPTAAVVPNSFSQECAKGRTSTTQCPRSDSDDDDLSTGAIVGIVVACVVVAALIAYAVAKSGSDGDAAASPGGDDAHAVPASSAVAAGAAGGTAVALGGTAGATDEGHRVTGEHSMEMTALDVP